MFFFIPILKLSTRESIRKLGWDSQSAKCFAKENRLTSFIKNALVPFKYHSIEEGNHRCLAIQILKYEMKEDIRKLNCMDVPMLVFCESATDKEIQDYCTCMFFLMFLVLSRNTNFILVKNITNNKGVDVTFGDKFFNVLTYYNDVLEFKRALNRKTVNCTKAELKERIPYEVEARIFFKFFFLV